ncbi:hypothetical protein [Paludisphaera mucosa]|uniref:FeoB-associated Cys-rich membrane protein n=1 Tax=Paludisphaera mucosa TaxID=3030827 RepID=A0ABT6F576_9BACT|nr:hypothetical protein [Paludisphaera mucosa]MDG3002735.1 hypothetical protein [Paludisphaera mucosa]
MGWQDVVAIAAVLGAASYLGSLVWRGLAGEKSAGCGSSCGKCSSAGGTEPAQLVSIGLASPAKGRERSGSL